MENDEEFQYGYLSGGIVDIEKMGLECKWRDGVTSVFLLHMLLLLDSIFGTRCHCWIRFLLMDNSIERTSVARAFD